MYLTTLLTMGLMCSNRWLFQQPFFRDLPFKINTYEFMLMVRCNWHIFNCFYICYKLGCIIKYSRKFSRHDGICFFYLYRSGSGRHCYCHWYALQSITPPYTVKLYVRISLHSNVFLFGAINEIKKM